jgi:hypothetical protein
VSGQRLNLCWRAAEGCSPDGGLTAVRSAPDTCNRALERAKSVRKEVMGLDIGEEESPYIIEPVEDPVPREVPVPEREEEIPA